MAIRIAINGFGRIGRLTFRNLIENPNVEVVAINDLTDNTTLAHLLKFDSAHGIFPHAVSADEKFIYVDNNKINAYEERDPAKLPWKDLGVDVVLECTGIFTSKDKAGLHLEAGAKKVIISAPPKEDSVKTIVLGVNDYEITPEIDLYSNASCTTNCLSPLVKVIVENWGYEIGSMTTTHAYTQDQNLQDSPHKDLRRARAAAYNIVPTSTGATKAVALVFPQIKGKMLSFSMRVPVITGSLVDLNCMISKDVTVEEINATFKKYAENELKGILQYSTDPLVSSDIVGNKHSSIFDSQLTMVSGRMIKIVSWYDNEAGYSARLAEIATRVI